METTLQSVACNDPQGCVTTGEHGDEVCDILDFMAKEVGLTVLHPGGLKATDEMLSRCAGFQSEKVLDVACGKGSSSVRFSKTLGCDVVGIDIDDSLLTLARALVRKNRMADTVRFRQADATRLPFEDGTFDQTLFQAALVLIDDDREAMREAVRAGIRKVNIGRAVKKAAFHSVQERSSHTGSEYPGYEVFGAGGPADLFGGIDEAIGDAVRKLMDSFGSSGRA